MLAVLIFGCAPIAFAQGANDYHKLEVYGGYSLARTALAPAELPVGLKNLAS